MVSSALLVQFEVNCDFGLDLDRLAIEIVRLVSPLTHRFHRSAGKNRVAVKNLRIDDDPLFVDRRFDAHFTLSMSRLCGRRIFRWHAFYQQTLGDAL